MCWSSGTLKPTGAGERASSTTPPSSTRRWAQAQAPRTCSERRLLPPLSPPTSPQILPIYELVRFSTAADHVGARLANLRRGWDEYLQHFDPCRCAPCRHNGVPVLTRTSCKCICRSGYQGDACEETLRPGERAPPRPAEAHG